MVARIVRRYRHDRTGPIFHQHEVGDPDRHLVSGQGMNGPVAGVHAFLFHRRNIGFGGTGSLAGIDKCLQRRITRRCLLGQWMFGRNRQIGHPHQRVRPRRIDRQRCGRRDIAFDIKVHFHAFRTPDPVALHRTHLLGPAFELVDIREQLFSIVGDLHEPLSNLPALDRGVTAPTTPIYDLLIGQHRLIVRTPVDRSRLFVCQTFAEQACEQPLFPAVIVGFAGGQLARPIVAKSERFELIAHVVDVLIGPSRRRHLVRDSRILRGQAKRIPPHRLQYILSLHFLIARDDVTDGVVAHMPHVQTPARIGEHRQAIELFLVSVLGHREDIVLLPQLAGRGFDCFGIVFCAHNV